jgi:hypothetical protein
MRLRAGDDGIPPHVMWPEPGSGFEASPLTPAGRTQGLWLLTPRGEPARRMVIVAATAFLVCMIVAFVWSLLTTFL